MYLVGGAVRDRVAGLPAKDLDFVVEADSFEEMKDYIQNIWGVTVFVELPTYGTIRGRFTPIKVNGTVDSRYFHDIVLGAQGCDFVLARKEGHYTDGRRPDSTEVGTLMDDLRRRDFTMNAMAMGEDGVIIDPFDGQGHLEYRVLSAVGDPVVRLLEDALRALRAIRFSVTKDLTMDHRLSNALLHAGVLHALENNIAIERISDELQKALRHDTIRTLDLLHEYKDLRSIIFAGQLWLRPDLGRR